MNPNKYIDYKVKEFESKVSLTNIDNFFTLKELSKETKEVLFKSISNGVKSDLGYIPDYSSLLYDINLNLDKREVEHFKDVANLILEIDSKANSIDCIRLDYLLDNCLIENSLFPYILEYFEWVYNVYKFHEYLINRDLSFTFTYEGILMKNNLDTFGFKETIIGPLVIYYPIEFNNLTADSVLSKIKDEFKRYLYTSDISVLIDFYKSYLIFNIGEVYG